MTLKKKIFTLFSAIFAIAVFYYLFQTVTLTEIKQLLKELNLKLLALFFVLSIFMNTLRVWRYQILLVQSKQSVNSFLLFLVVLIRNVFSDLLPARIGTVIYVYIVNSRLNVNFGAASSSFALAFLFDVLAMPPLILLAILFAAGASLPVFNLIIASLILFLITLGLIIYLPAICNIFQKYFSPLKSVTEELRKCSHPSLLIKVFCLSILIRLTKYLALFVFLVALLIPLGYELQSISLLKSFLGMTAAEAAASLPIGSLGGFGAYEGAWAVTFNLLGFPEKVANITAVMHHLFTQVYGYGLGLLAACILLLPLKKLVNIFSIPKGYFLVKFILSTAILFGLYSSISLFATKSLVQAEGPKKTLATKDDQLTGLKIIFDSNRSGTFGIYQINSDGSGLSTVIDTEAHEIYPDTNSGKIVYAQHETLSRFEKGEIWIIEGKNPPRKIISNGTYPTISNDAKSVFFERERKQVWKYNLETNEESLLFPKPKHQYNPFAVVKPRISADNKFVSFTGDKDGRWHAYIANLETGKVKLINHGCEPTWINNQELAFIKQKDVLEGSGVYHFNKKTKEISSIEDLGAPFGHEYFPTVTQDGKYLLYSSCPADQHDHNTSNYQIFIKDLTTKKTYRVTNDAFTNRWAKLSG